MIALHGVRAALFFKYCFFHNADPPLKRSSYQRRIHFTNVRFSKLQFSLPRHVPVLRSGLQGVLSVAPAAESFGTWQEVSLFYTPALRSFFQQNFEGRETDKTHYISAQV